MKKKIKESFFYNNIISPYIYILIADLFYNKVNLFKVGILDPYFTQ